ncbi:MULTISPECIES: response regulator [Cupriavidus]
MSHSIDRVRRGMMIQVLIADDHPVVVNGIRRELGDEVGFEVAGTAYSPTELLRLLDTTQCDVLVTDYSMPGSATGDGLPMLQLIRRRHPAVRIVVITMLDNPALLRNIQKAGISVILSKSDHLGHLAPAIRAAFVGIAYLAPAVQALLGDASDEAGAPEPKLSKRELEVVRKCAAGVPLVEIARQANRSSKTISAQKSMAMRKLGLTSDYELYQYAVTHGMLAAAQ